MAESAKYRPSFSDLAAEFILSLPKRRQRAVKDRAYELARYPDIHFSRATIGWSIMTAERLSICSLTAWFSYWIDHALKLVMISEIEDAQ